MYGTQAEGKTASQSFQPRHLSNLFALQVFITGVNYVRKFVTEDIAALGEDVKGHAVFLSYMMVLLVPLALSSPVLNHIEPEVMVDSHPQDVCDDDNDTAEGRMEEEKAGYYPLRYECTCQMHAVLSRISLLVPLLLQTK